MFLRCKQGANATQNGIGFKNVSCESAYRQRWELFLKWVAAVITSPSVAPCATEIFFFFFFFFIFILAVHSDMLSPFPHFPPPHSGRQAWSSLTSVICCQEKEGRLGGAYKPLWSTPVLASPRRACPLPPPGGCEGKTNSSSWWGQRAKPRPTERPPEEVSSGPMGKFWHTSSLFMDRLKRSDEWQYLVVYWEEKPTVFPTVLSESSGKIRSVWHQSRHELKLSKPLHQQLPTVIQLKSWMLLT